MTSPEHASTPEERIEAQALTMLGYSHCLNTVVTDEAGQPVINTQGEVVTGQNFLDAYGDSPHRENTENLLYGFIGMHPSHPAYEKVKAIILLAFDAKFGRPQPSSEDTLQ